MPRLLICALWSTCMLPLLPACSEEPGETTLLTTVFAINAPEGDGGSESIRDANGIFNLQAFPAFVAVTINGADMDRISALWPETTEEFAVGEQNVELELDVPAGASRDVRLAVFMFQQDRPHCFVEAEPYSIDLTPGGTPTLDIQPIDTGAGAIAGPAPDNATEVWLIDAETLVRLDRTMVAQGEFGFEHVCAIRQLTLGWVDSDNAFHLDPLTVFTLVPGEELTEMALPQ